MFRDALDRLAVEPARLAALEPELERMVGWLDGRVYYRLESFHVLFEAHPLFALYRPHWERTIGLDRPLDRAAAEHGALSTARAVLNVGWRLARIDRDMAALEARFVAAGRRALEAARERPAPARAPCATSLARSRSTRSAPGARPS